MPATTMSWVSPTPAGASSSPGTPRRPRTSLPSRGVSPRTTRTPFFVVQDGFLTTHTLENVRLPEDELLRTFVGDPRERIDSPVRPRHGAHDRRRAEPGQLHEGPDRAARLLRRAAAALTRRWTTGRRRPVDSTAISMPTGATTPTGSSWRWGPSPTRPGPWSTCCVARVVRSVPWASPRIDRFPPTTSPRCSETPGLSPSSSEPMSRPLPTTR